MPQREGDDADGRIAAAVVLPEPMDEFGAAAAAAAYGNAPPTPYTPLRLDDLSIDVHAGEEQSFAGASGEDGSRNPLWDKPTPLKLPPIDESEENGELSCHNIDQLDIDEDGDDYNDRVRDMVKSVRAKLADALNGIDQLDAMMSRHRQASSVLVGMVVNDNNSIVNSTGGGNTQSSKAKHPRRSLIFNDNEGDHPHRPRPRHRIAFIPYFN